MERFFLGGNTAYGFKGFYEDEIAGADNVILLKGAPGTGKSTLIKSVGAECARRGLDYEMWYCSGDPESADGIFVRELSAAVADATSPHPCETMLPVVRERIVDMAKALRREKLLPFKGSIEKLINDKKRSYSRAYDILKCASSHFHNAERDYFSQADVVRIRRLAAAFALREGGGAGERARCRNVFSRAITPCGTKAFFEHLAGRRIWLIEGGEEGALLFAGEAARLIPSAVAVHHPLLPERVECVLWEGCALTTDAGPFRAAAERIELDDGRAALAARMERTLCRECVNEAEKVLAAAREAHIELEKIYAEGMDYSVTDAIAEEVKRAVFAL